MENSSAENGFWIIALILAITALICLYIGFRIGFVWREAELSEESDETIYALKMEAQDEKF